MKKRYVKHLTVLLACTMLLSACKDSAGGSKTQTDTTNTSTTETSSDAQDVNSTPTDVVTSSNKDTVNVEPKVFSISENHKLFIDSNGTLWGWGDNEDGELGLETDTRGLLPFIIMTDVRDMISEDASVNSNVKDPYSLVLKNDGTLYVFGGNSVGQLGTGDTHERRTPTQVMSDVDAIFAKDLSVCAIKKDGTLWVWGEGWRTTNNLLPEQVMTDVKTVSFPYSLSNSVLVLKNDNTVWSCNGPDTYQITDSVKTILPLGNGNNYAIKSDDSLWTWSEEIPLTQVMPDVKDIAGGWGHILILKNDGTLWSYGKNEYGQLGTGNAIDTAEPTQIMTNVQAISAGTESGFAITENKVLLAWGKGGAVGSGNQNDQLTPIQILTDVESVSTIGESAAMAVKTDNTVWAWGNDIDYSGDMSAPTRQLFRAVPNESGENEQWMPVQ